MKKRDWVPLNIKFRQKYANGYKYLDNCGQFILKAVDKYNFLPTETKTTGAKLSLPEKGVRFHVDTHLLELAHELPIDQSMFIEMAEWTSQLADECFGKLDVEQNAIIYQLYLQFSKEDETEQAMLKIGGMDFTDASKSLNMGVKSHKINVTFESGSQQLILQVYPGTFETVRMDRYNPAIGATRSQKSRATRLDAEAGRYSGIDPYAIVLQLDLVEYDPPKDSLVNLHKLLLEKASEACSLYNI